MILIIIKYLQKSYRFSNNNSDSELDSFSRKKFSHLLPRIILNKNNDNDDADNDSNLDAIIPSLKVYDFCKVYKNL